MTILRHPSLPEVEPEPLRFTFGCKFIAESSPRLPRITGPLGDDEEDAAQKWNDWVRPLVELQAEVERLRSEAGAYRKDFLLANDQIDRLLADLAAANARADALLAERDYAVEMLADWCVRVDDWGTSWDDWDEAYKDAAYREGPLRQLIDAEMARIRADRAALTDQPEQPA